MKESTIKLIDEHLQKARNKYPVFPCMLTETVSIAAEELGEFAQAINDYFAADLKGYKLKKKLADKIKSKALDLIVLMVRHIEGDC